MNPDEFLVFVDETGSEGLKDPNYPLFGLGGICVLAKDYDQLVRAPWLQIREEYFDGAKSLHGVRNFTELQQNILNHFFSNFQFCRIATMAHIKTEFHPELTVYDTVGGSLVKRMEGVCGYQNFSGITIIFEASERANSLAVQCFSRFDTIKDETGNKIGGVNKFFMTKETAEPGLEVAHFVVHTAGRQERHDRNHGKGLLPDYANVFNSIGDKFVSYLSIDHVAANP